MSPLQGCPEPGDIGQSPGEQGMGSSLTRMPRAGELSLPGLSPCWRARKQQRAPMLEPGQAALEELTCSLAAGVGSY